MPYTPTADDINWMQQQLAQNQQQAGNSYIPSAPGQQLAPKGINEDPTDPVNQFLKQYGDAKNSSLMSNTGALLAGAGQGLEHAGASALNVPSYLASKLGINIPKVPYVNLQQYTAQDPQSRLAFDIGNIGSYAIPYTAGAKVVDAALEGAPALAESLSKALPGLSNPAVKGATTGFAISGNDGNEDSNRLTGALLGGAAGSLQSLSAGNLANSLKTMAQNAKQKYEGLYNDISNQVNNAGLGNKDNIINIKQMMNPPGQLANIKDDPNYGPVFDKFSGDAKASVQRFMGNPSYKNAHQLQSDLGKEAFNKENYVQRTIESPSGKQVLSVPGEASNLASRLQQQVRDSIQDFFTTNNRPDLADLYKTTTQGYKQEVAPFLNPDMEKAFSGKLGNRALVQAMQRNPDFTDSGIGSQIPGWGTRRALSLGYERTPKKPLFAGIGIGALGAGIPGAYYLSKALGGH